VHVPNTVTAKLVKRFLPASPSASPPPNRHEEALAVLSATRGVIARGWSQNSWYVVQTPAGRLLSPRPEYAYPAIDALWHTLFDTGTDVGPVSSPLVRASRVRDLTTWNDRNYRTREDVLRLVDRATARLSASSPVRA
jgi:hypothetical protein